MNISDGPIIGGIIGFIEDSINQEDTYEEDFLFSENNISEDNINNINLKIFYRQNPKIFLYLLNKFLKLRSKANRETAIVLREIELEIQEMEKQSE